jgi:hypothetical protein
MNGAAQRIFGTMKVAARLLREAMGAEIAAKRATTNIYGCWI